MRAKRASLRAARSGPSTRAKAALAQDDNISFSLMRERNVDSRGEQHVVGLLSRRRIGHVNIPKAVLPSKPLADFRDGAKAKRRAVLAGVVEVRENIALFRDDRAFT